MAADDPNGKSRIRGGPGDLAVAWIAVLALLLATVLLVTVFGNPHAGDPFLRMAVNRASLNVPENRQAMIAPQKTAPENVAPLLPPTFVPPIVTKPVYAGRALVADPALIEPTPSGPLPKVASDGRTPMSAYAGVMPLPLHQPRIAIVITGLGISARQTEAALHALPPSVTLAFAPYADDVRSWVNEARKDGHEVLLEVPMEPNEFPDRDPGPHTLRAGQDENANTERLVWALTRFTGYAGVTNLEGGRFLTDADSLQPVLAYMARRGLLFFDNGETPRSMAPAVAGRVGIAFAQSTARLDSIPTAMEIDNKLAQLEAIARTRGSATGTAYASPQAIDRIAQWAAGLGSRGSVLVPASAVVSPPKTE